jgi:hypothetical protein
MNVSKRILITLMLFAVLVAACGNAGTATPQDVNVVYTGVVQTIVASYFDTQTAQVPPTNPIPTLPIITIPVFTQGPLPTAIPSATRPFYTATIGTIAPIFTPSPTGTLSTPTVNPSVLAFGCNNLAFVRDVTLPAGTELKPGEDFTKTWKVANTGTCPWMYVYRLVLISGNDFGAPALRLGKMVAVNSWTEISLQMGAPKKTGTYNSYWRMADGDGNMFGSTLAVSFTVVEPADTSLPSETPTP